MYLEIKVHLFLKLPIHYTYQTSKPWDHYDIFITLWIPTFVFFFWKFWWLFFSHTFVRRDGSHHCKCTSVMYYRTQTLKGITCWAEISLVVSNLLYRFLNQWMLQDLPYWSWFTALVVWYEYNAYIHVKYIVLRLVYMIKVCIKFIFKDFLSWKLM